ncbi:hypothetical protein OPV22_013763 [Ensete ventricosum]|uniref:Uncharacterized protein n=1 Tax=Ensete ventricosum TaxID=4639 RepID=A0AAV8R9Z7_ENSVE|nr:hypothetical protein OPV22_013763 [Ensete ventricosum]
MEHGFTRARTRLARTGLELDASRPCVARGPPEAVSLAGTPRCVGKLSAQPPLRLRVRSGIPDRKTTEPDASPSIPTHLQLGSLLDGPQQACRPSTATGTAAARVPGNSDAASQTLGSQGGDPQGALFSAVRNREKGRGRCLSEACDTIVCFSFLSWT